MEKITRLDFQHILDMLVLPCLLTHHLFTPVCESAVSSPSTCQSLEMSGTQDTGNTFQRQRLGSFQATQARTSLTLGDKGIPYE